MGPANIVTFPPLNEYKILAGGNKAAEELRAVERDRMKSKTCRRKKFRVAMERLIAGGADSHTAILRIYKVYVHRKVSYILKAMARHEPNGDHLLLRR